jgi:hypothetical protein
MKAPAPITPIDLHQITADDLAAWLQHTNCQYQPDSRQLGWYVTAYNVGDKIKRAKRSGQWDAIRQRLDEDRSAAISNLTIATAIINNQPAAPRAKHLKLVR